MSNRTSIKSMFCWPKQWNRSVVAFSFVFCIVDTALCNHLIRNRESSTHHFCNRALLNPTEDYTFMASVPIITWDVVQRLSLMEYYLFYWLFLLIQWFAQLPACSCTQCSSIHVCVCVCVCVCVHACMCLFVCVRVHTCMCLCVPVCLIVRKNASRSLEQSSVC